MHLPPSRASGADPVKLQRQIALYWTSVDGMPALWVYRGSDGALMIYDGVTRATRGALLLPGTRARRSHWGPHGPLWSFASCWSTITMIPPVRQEILRVLADLSACCPDVRFGQLLANLSYLAKGPTNEAIWEMEDEELLAAAQQHLATLRQRHTSVP